ncbi:MAG: nickel pincer cofactor biosynthesis protein LarB [Candidatus Bipolaricaulota bacterium]|nr:nickel pincer cofactor biosynthesis protein LarB [Candidatus Bipolaricaulota bacterium]
MNIEKIRGLLENLKQGKVSVEDAMHQLENLPFKDLEHTKIDSHRSLRRGAPEAVYCEDKTEDQVLEILEEMVPESSVLATRVNSEVLEKIKDIYPEALTYPESNLAFIGEYPDDIEGKVAVVTAGTSDIPVARKSEVTARSMGVDVDTIFDVGVSGLHRVISVRDRIVEADMAIVVAGMEGALPSVVAGLVDTPVIAVPTAVGYGTNLNGITPLLGMLNSCAPGITVVNIGDGYGAGYFAAATINKIKGTSDATSDIDTEGDQ